MSAKLVCVCACAAVSLGCSAPAEVVSPDALVVRRPGANAIVIV